MWCDVVDGGRRATEALNHGGCQFCWERLEDIRNGRIPHSQFTLWRDVDFDTIVFYRRYIKNFIATVAGDGRTRGQTPIGCGKVQIAEDTWGNGYHSFYRKSHVQVDYWVNMIRSALEACPAGLWQAPWPVVNPELRFLVSRPEFQEEVAKWPPEIGLTGVEYRDLIRVAQLLRGLENLSLIHI